MKARVALRQGLIEYDRKQGYHGPYKQIELGEDWGVEISKLDELDDVPGWRQAVVLEVGDTFANVGLRPRRLVSRTVSEEREVTTVYLEDAPWANKLSTKVKGEKRKSKKISKMTDLMQVGDVIHVSSKDDRYILEQVPAVSGALVAMNPHTGRVLAMMGGFSFKDSQFNRATQARRQPGSSFKPFVYAAALDNGYTPSSVVLDGPFKLALWFLPRFDGERHKRERLHVEHAEPPAGLGTAAQRDTKPLFTAVIEQLWRPLSTATGLDHADTLAHGQGLNPRQQGLQGFVILSKKVSLWRGALHFQLRLHSYWRLCHRRLFRWGRNWRCGCSSAAATSSTPWASTACAASPSRCPR